MPEIDFEEQETYVPHHSVSKEIERTSLAGLLIAYGVVRTKQQAILVLIGISIACVLILLFLWWPEDSEIQYTTTPSNLEEAGGPRDFIVR